MKLDTPVYLELILDEKFFPVEQDINKIEFDWLPGPSEYFSKTKNGYAVLHAFFQHKFGSKEFEVNPAWEKAFLITDNESKLKIAEKFFNYLMENDNLKSVVSKFVNNINDNSEELFKKDINKLYKDFQICNKAINTNQNINIEKGYYWNFYLNESALPTKQEMSEVNDFSVGFNRGYNRPFQNYCYEILHDFLNNIFSPKKLKQSFVDNKIIVVTDEVGKLLEVQSFINHLEQNQLLKQWSDLIYDFDNANLVKNLQITYESFNLSKELSGQEIEIKRPKL